MRRPPYEVAPLAKHGDQLLAAVHQTKRDPRISLRFSLRGALLWSADRKFLERSSPLSRYHLRSCVARRPTRRLQQLPPLPKETEGRVERAKRL